MVRTEVENNSSEVIDEISDYVDMRSVGSSEAAWHIFNFIIAKKYPAVYALRVHLEHEQSVVFDMDTAEESVENQRFTELMCDGESSESVAILSSHVLQSNR